MFQGSTDVRGRDREGGEAGAGGAPLLDRAVAGDTAALRELLAIHGPRARAAVVTRIDRRWRAVLDEDDVMQVAYMEAFLHIHQLTARDERSFVAWLTRIAENALRDAVRGLTRDKRPDPARRIQAAASGWGGAGGGGGSQSQVALLDLLGVTTSTPSRAAAANETALTLESALERLPRDYATVVRLYDLQGLAPVAVAARMERSVGAVHMLRGRAHERLREVLGGVGPGGGGSRFFSSCG